MSNVSLCVLFSTIVIIVFLYILLLIHEVFAGGVIGGIALVLIIIASVVYRYVLSLMFSISVKWFPCG